MENSEVEKKEGKMSNYWKDKLVPKVRQILSLDKPNKKKLAAAEACKSFNESKEEFEKVLVEKKEELTPKVIEIYEAQSLAVKGVVKDRKTQAMKKNSKACQQFLDELVKIEFPGSAPACEASTKHGFALVSETVFYVFEKVITFIPVEELKKEETEVEKAEKEAEAPVVEETTRELPPPETTTTEPTPVVEEAPSAAVVVVEEKKKEVVVVEEKKEEVAAAPPPAAEPKK